MDSKVFIRIIAFCSLIGWATPGQILSETGSMIPVGNFSSSPAGTSLPEFWKPLTFSHIERQTNYSLVQDGGKTVVKAESKAAASGLVREIPADPREYPILRWQWKIGNILEKGDVYRKRGDDYPARIYVTFDYDVKKLRFYDRLLYEAIRLFYGQAPPLRAINYIWESRAPRGTFISNSYTDWVMMVVVESGEDKLNEWVGEERNLYEDYKKAFGEEPQRITGMAIMTDTDDTGESATAYYGDIFLKKKTSGNSGGILAAAGPSL